MNTIRIWFTKTGEASYISLLDMQRVMSRCIKRSGINAWYTLGFNPHVYMSFSCPLPLGQESYVESVDVKCETEPDYDLWKNSLNAVMPYGIEVTKVAPAMNKADEIATAVYSLYYPYSDKLSSAIEGYNRANSVIVMKKSKKGLKEFDLKSVIPAIAYTVADSNMQIILKLPAGVSFTVNPSLITEYFQRVYDVKTCECRIVRTALLQKNGEKFA